MKKIIYGLVIVALGLSIMAFTPANKKKGSKASQLEQEISALKVQVADLNLRVTKLETTLAKPKKKSGGFQAR